MPRTQDSNSRNLLFVAGDLSGDVHTAKLAHLVRDRHPDWNLWGLGGSHLRDAGPQMLGDTSNCSVIGLVSSLALVPRVALLFRHTVRFISSQPLDAVVLCDWGAFNGRLLPKLKALNVPVLYYFPPRSWQRTGQRGLSIAPYLTRVATPFEWSAQRLTEAGCQAEWVGHPILETVRPLAPDAPERLALRRDLGVPDGAQLVALLPGSRALELRYIAPHVADAVRLVQKQISQPIQFTVALPQNSGAARRAGMSRLFPSEVKIVEGQTTDILMAADAAIVKSGTSTLEAAVAGAPQVVVYDGPKVMRAQAHLMGVRKRVPFVAMPNILLQRRIVPELLGADCHGESIANALQEILQQQEVRQRMKEDYALVRQALGTDLPKGATQRTAEILEEMLKG